MKVFLFLCYFSLKKKVHFLGKKQKTKIFIYRLFSFGV